jgi:ATP-dependent Clp protease ATP-binding subunit ClpA
MRHRYIGPEHFLLAIADDTKGVAARILLDHDADGEKIREEVIGTLAMQGRLRGDRGASLRDQPRRTVEPGSLEGLDQLLDWLSLEVPRELGRVPDLGDVLIAFACARETLPGQVLNQLGIEPAGLRLQVDRLRLETSRVRETLAQQIRDVEHAKQQATEAMDFERAAQMRAEERDLLQREHQRSLVGRDTLRTLRRYLAIPEASDTAP